MAANLLMQFTFFEHITCRSTNKMLLRSTNPWEIPRTHPSSYLQLCRLGAICMHTTVSPKCGTQFVRRLVLCGRLVILLTRMDQCSRLALNFSDRSLDSFILLRFCSATLRRSFCFYSALRQGRRGNIALIASQGSGGKFPPSSTKTKPRTAKTHVVSAQRLPTLAAQIAVR